MRSYIDVASIRHLILRVYDATPHSGLGLQGLDLKDKKYIFGIGIYLNCFYSSILTVKQHQFYVTRHLKDATFVKPLQLR